MKLLETDSSTLCITVQHDTPSRGNDEKKIERRAHETVAAMASKVPQTEVPALVESAVVRVDGYMINGKSVLKGAWVCCWRFPTPETFADFLKMPDVERAELIDLHAMHKAAEEAVRNIKMAERMATREQLDGALEVCERLLADAVTEAEVVQSLRYCEEVMALIDACEGKSR